MKATNNKRYSIQLKEMDLEYGKIFPERVLVDNETGKFYLLRSKTGGQEVNRPMINVNVVINGRLFTGATENELINKIIKGESDGLALF